MPITPPTTTAASPGTPPPQDSGPRPATPNHYWSLQLTRPAGRDEVLDALPAACIAFIRMADGLTAPDITAELMRDLGRPRRDMWEGFGGGRPERRGDQMYLTYQVCTEAIVGPDTIDAIRALTARLEHGLASIAMTDEVLGMRRELLPDPVRAVPARAAENGPAGAEPEGVHHLSGPPGREGDYR